MAIAPAPEESLQDLFPKAGPELLRLHAGATANGNLSATDSYTIRDLLDLSGYEEEESLHALLLVLLVALDEGSPCIEASERGLAQRLAGLTDEAEANVWAERIVADLRQDSFPALIGRRVDDAKPVIVLNTSGRTYVYFQKYLRHEELLLTELKKRLTPPHASHAPRSDGFGGTGSPSVQVCKAILQEVLTANALRQSGRPLELNRDQQIALGLSLLRDFVIISGGPGTGKTSIVFTLLRCLLRLGVAPERIAVAAPTGRAAQRLTDSIRDGLDRLDGPLPASSPDSLLRSLTPRTLHHLLRYHPGRGIFMHHAENPLPADVVIVDEVSMVGVVLMAQLFQALRPGVKLVLLGDKDQLASVEAGAVLANVAGAVSRPQFSAGMCARLAELWKDLDLKPASGFHPLEDSLVVLEENYRSQPQIQVAARAINLQQTAALALLRMDAGSVDRDGNDPPATLDGRELTLFADMEQRAGCWLLDRAGESLTEWRTVLEQWASHHYLKAPQPDAMCWNESYAELVARCELPSRDQIMAQENGLLSNLLAMAGEARVLTLVREGPWGCQGVNAFLSQLLRPRLDPGSRGRLFAGALVLITRNDYGRQLFNGDVGIVLKGRDGGYRAAFQRHDGFVSYPTDALPANELAFALTVHKSQGSEYGQVLLVLPPEGGRRLLTKEMVYTGVTRAKRLALVCATREVLEYSVRRTIARESGLLRFV
jgi:exodeoxyribonuclease V alpha subunit